MVRHMADAKRCALMREKLYTPIIPDRGEDSKRDFYARHSERVSTKSTC